MKYIAHSPLLTMIFRLFHSKTSAVNGSLLLFLMIFVLTANVLAQSSAEKKSSDSLHCKPIYLTFDTGHMGVADHIAAVLKRQQVRVTFFAANEATQTGDGSLGEHWANWWKARALENHEFASHSWDHVYWLADVFNKNQNQIDFQMRPSAGDQAGKKSIWTAKSYCDQLKASNARLQKITGKTPLPLFRAPGGKTSPALLAAAKSCGFAHVAWSNAGFLGDELSSERFSNADLLQKALRDIRSGDILLAHLGIWSRKEVWALGVLEPLIEGLKAKGFCFSTLREHPDYEKWIQTHSIAN